MRYLLLLIAAAFACQAPDRWSAGVSRGNGSIDSRKVDFDTEDTRLEVGVSGPIFAPPPAPRPQPAPERCATPSAVKAAAEPPSERHEDYTQLATLALTLILGSGATVGAHYGHRAYKAKKARS